MEIQKFEYLKKNLNFSQFLKSYHLVKKKKKKAGKSFNKYSIDYFVNPFHAIGLFLYPLKTLPYHEILPLLITKTSLAPPLIYCGHNFLVQINEKHNIVLITENLIVLLLFSMYLFQLPLSNRPNHSRSATKRQWQLSDSLNNRQIKNTTLNLSYTFAIYS